MAKTKTNGATASSKVPDVLSKAKDAAVTKPLQAAKAKGKELAQQVAGKPEKKSKKAREPTPESSEDDSASGSEDDDSEVETATPALNGKTNGKTNGTADSSDESESSEDEAPKAKSAAATNGTKGKTAAKAESSGSEDEQDDEDDSDESDDEAAKGAKAGADSDDSESDEEEDSDAEDRKSAPVKKSTDKKAAADSEDSADEDDGDDSDDSASSEDEKPAQKSASTKRKAEEDAPPVEKKAKVTEAYVEGQSNNLFVGNISWNVDEEWLKSEFESFGELAGTRIVMDRDTGRSKGFGYVEFVEVSDAVKAHGQMKGHQLDGRQLNVDFATARSNQSTPRDKQQARARTYGDSLSEPSDTVFVGNLSFDAGQDALSSAFDGYGTILSVRIPTNPETQQPKGFAYVTFSSVDEAKAAVESLQGADVEGRAVRLDFSQPRTGDSGRGGGRGGFGGRGRGGFGDRGGRGGFGDRGGRGGFGGRGRGGDRGGRGAPRTNTTNRGGFGDFSGKKMTF